MARARRPKAGARLLTGMTGQASRRDAPLGPPATRPAAGASGHGHQEATEQRRTAENARRTKERDRANGSGRQHEAASGERRPFRAPDQALEPEDEALHLHRTQ